MVRESEPVEKGDFLPVAVYGMSSEGYSIAAKLATKGFDVSLIDENLGIASKLAPEIAADHKDLEALIADEPALTMRSLKETLGIARVVFFAPKLRRRDEDILSEVKSRLSEVGRYISSGTLVVFLLPLGIGGTREVIDRLEHATGLSSGKSLFFAYCPLEAAHPTFFGCESPLADFSLAIDGAGLKLEVFGLQKAELVHGQRVLQRHAVFASYIEVARRLTLSGQDSPREFKQIYAEDLSASAFDLRLLINSLDAGDPLLYLGSGSQKSLEAYSRFLVDRIRELVRQKELKAARLRIILFSDTDSREMRGDKIRMAEDLADRLRDFFSDIEYRNIMSAGFTMPMEMDKTNLLIFLSGSCEQKLIQLYEDQISMAKSHMIRANLPVEFVD